MTNFVKPSELKTLLTAAIARSLPVLITGAPGIGKTEIVEQSSHDVGADVILSHPVTSDPTDAKGLPARISDTEAAFLPFGELKLAINAVKPTVWFLDDLGQASPSVQAAFMQLILARRINGHKLPDCVTFVAATNRRSDKAGVTGILEPVKSRFTTIVELRADVTELCQWAMASAKAAKIISPAMIAFWRFRPDLVSDFHPTADLTNSPNPRTWFNAGCIESLKLPAALEHVAMAGSVGEGAATEYLSYRKMAATLVSLDAIITAPDKAALPKKPAEYYAISTGLASRANDKTLGRIGTYLERMVHDDKGEFAALCVRDSLHRTPALANTSEYVKLMCGPIGQLISGQAIR